MDLGVVIQDSQSRVDVEMITEEADANALYDEATNNLKYRTPVMRADGGRVLAAEREQAAREYYASVRTNVRASFLLRIAFADMTSLPRCCSHGSCLTSVIDDRSFPEPKFTDLIDRACSSLRSWVQVSPSIPSNREVVSRPQRRT